MEEEKVEQVTAQEQVQSLSWQDREAKIYGAEPRVSVYIPSDSALAATREYENHCVIRLGASVFYVPIGENAEVPESVAFVINESLQRSKEASDRVKELSERSKKGVVFSV